MVFQYVYFDAIMSRCRKRFDKHMQKFTDSCKANQIKSSKTSIYRYRKMECIQLHFSLIINYPIILKLVFPLEQAMKTQKGIEL